MIQILPYWTRRSTYGVGFCVGTDAYEYNSFTCPTRTPMCWPSYILHVVAPKTVCRLVLVILLLIVIAPSCVGGFLPQGFSHKNPCLFVSFISRYYLTHSPTPTRKGGVLLLVGVGLPPLARPPPGRLPPPLLLSIRGQGSTPKTQQVDH